MRISISARALVTGLLVAAVAAPAAAQTTFTQYLSRAAFNAATSNQATDTFDDLNSTDVFKFVPSPIDRSVPPYSYRASAQNDLFIVWPTGTNYLSVNDATKALVLSNLPSNVRGIGGFFFNTLSNGDPAPFTSLTITAMAVDNTTQSFTILPTSTTDFFGIVSTSPFLTFSILANNPTVTVPDQDVAMLFASTASITLAAGGGAVNVVPEPMTVALVAPALFAVGYWHRRRARSS